MLTRHETKRTSLKQWLIAFGLRLGSVTLFMYIYCIAHETAVTINHRVEEVRRNLYARSMIPFSFFDNRDMPPCRQPCTSSPYYCIVVVTTTHRSLSHADSLVRSYGQSYHSFVEVAPRTHLHSSCTIFWQDRVSAFAVFIILLSAPYYYVCQALQATFPRIWRSGDKCPDYWRMCHSSL